MSDVIEVDAMQVEEKTTNLNEATKGLEQEIALSLKNDFTPFFQEAEKLTRQAKDIKVTSPKQIDIMERAREVRLSLKRIRNNLEKTRKRLKEESLRKGKAIDGMANIIKYLIVPVEEYLQEQEDFVKIQEEKKRAELAENREKELSQYSIDCSYYNLAEMPEAGYLQLLETSKKTWEAQKEAERKEEEERIAREKKEAEERERIRKENEQLKKEAKERRELQEKRQEQLTGLWQYLPNGTNYMDMSEEKFKILVNGATKAKNTAHKKAEKERKEREAQEEKLKTEQKEKERIEAELKAKEEAEEKAIRDKEEKERKARLAPDKEKLEKLAVQIVSMPLPELKSDEAKAVLSGTVELLNKVSSYIKEKSCNL